MRMAEPGDWWSLGDAEAIWVAPVTVRVADANLGRASAAFTVPELSPGTYHLMLCDTGCSEPLAEVTPVEGFTVVADPATVQMASRVDRVERRSRKQTRQLSEARADAYRASRTAGDARDDLEQLQVRVASLAKERRSSPPTPPWAYAGWLLAGALAFLLLLRRATVARGSRPRRHAPVEA
jgi:hypothetical protein